MEELVQAAVLAPAVDGSVTLPTTDSERLDVAVAALGKISRLKGGDDFDSAQDLKIAQWAARAALYVVGR